MSNVLRHSFTVLAKGLGICLFVILSCSAAVLAQTQITSGTIQGTVVDEKGAFLPGVSIEIKSLETNYSRTATTDEEGRFVALLLPSGKYTVTVAKPG